MFVFQTICQPRNLHTLEICIMMKCFISFTVLQGWRLKAQLQQHLFLLNSTFDPCQKFSKLAVTFSTSKSPRKQSKACLFIPRAPVYEAFRVCSDNSASKPEDGDGGAGYGGSIEGGNIRECSAPTRQYQLPAMQTRTAWYPVKNECQLLLLLTAIR